MSWDEVAQLSAAVEERLAEHAFPKVLLQGALKAAKDADNPIRGNLAASALRELIGWTLHALAPDDQVTDCSWYVPVAEAKNPVREARATFITQGGLSTKFVEEELGIEVEDLHKPMLDAMKKLNKYTHLREGTIVAAEGEVRELVGETIAALLSLFDEAEACRQAICDELIGHIDREIMDCAIGDTIPELDILSTHTLVEGHQIDTVKVVSLDSRHVRYAVEGAIFVTLQYGSGSDMERGDGATMKDGFPFCAQLEASVEKPEVLEVAGGIAVDTGKFFG